MKSSISGEVLSLFATHCLPDTRQNKVLGDVEIVCEGGLIRDMRCGIEQGDQPSGASLLLPPLSNAHDHGRGLKSLAYGVPDQPVETWVAATYTMPPVDPYLVAATAFARMVRSGIGSVTHCHLSRSPAALLEEAAAVRRAAHDVGIRVAFVVPLADRYRLGYAEDEAILTFMSSKDAELTRRRLRPIAPIEEQLDVAKRIMESADGLFQVQLGPVSIERCSDTLVERIARLSAERGNRVHMHMLESKYQRQWADHHYPRGLMRHLDSLGLLSPRLTMAHGTWLRPDECDLLAERGVIVSVNTSSNLRLRSGIAPLLPMQRAGLSFALGLDALALDDDDDLLREMRLARLLHGGTGFDEGIDRNSMLDALCRVGARAAGIEPGGIAPGAAADLLLLELDNAVDDTHPALYDMPSLVHCRATASNVHAMVIGGRVVVKEGGVTGIDETEIQRELTAQLHVHANDLSATRSQLEPYREAIERFYRAGGHCGGCA
ncbi:hydrolase [Pusillimonas caeni]|uniref:amidohydrolase family protein n=1 Tax=Pusillimonas caeni TaxID=1348472 RepID=UPI000E59988B|nr:amidohydrolase family protein [Pusillimonas caeni]TFL13115.1 hydrolase [Pusillimonas caeni]